jgi:hypothetical protein
MCYLPQCGNGTCPAEGAYIKEGRYKEPKWYRHGKWILGIEEKCKTCGHKRCNRCFDLDHEGVRAGRCVGKEPDGDLFLWLYRW